MKRVLLNQAGKLKTALIFTAPTFACLVTFSITALLAGCGSGSNITVPVSKSSTQRKGSSTDGSQNGGQSKETTTPMVATERQLAPLTALMRIQHSVALIYNPPTGKTDTRGCGTYTGLEGNGTFIVGQYTDCPWVRTISAKAKQTYILSGTETFESLADKPTSCSVNGDSFYTSTASLEIDLPRVAKGKPAPIVTKLSQFICAANHGAALKNVEATMAWGSQSNPKIANWKADLKSSTWSQLADGTVVLNKGAELSWEYMPATTTKIPNATFKTILKPLSTIGFAAKCPWPISGTAQLVEFDQAKKPHASLTLTFATNGVQLSDGTSFAWPTDHCAGTY